MVGFEDYGRGFVGYFLLEQKGLRQATSSILWCDWAAGVIVAATMVELAVSLCREEAEAVGAFDAFGAATILDDLFYVGFEYGAGFLGIRH